MMLNGNIIDGRQYREKSSFYCGDSLFDTDFYWGGYVIINHGEVNAGYAVVPSLWAVICLGYSRKRAKNDV